MVQASATGELRKVGGMSLAVSPGPVPLGTDTDVVVRVATTRVTLDTVAVFREGATAEKISQ